MYSSTGVECALRPTWRTVENGYGAYESTGSVCHNGVYSADALDMAASEPSEGYMSPTVRTAAMHVGTVVVVV